MLVVIALGGNALVKGILLLLDPLNRSVRFIQRQKLNS
jgi:carbamate kinase